VVKSSTSLIVSQPVRVQQLPNATECAKNNAHVVTTMFTIGEFKENNWDK